MQVADAVHDIPRSRCSLLPGRGLPDPEEVQVTFQLTMVGSDGILLASDTQVTEIGTNSYRETHSTYKIEIHEQEEVTYCCSGGDLALTAAEGILSNLRARQADKVLTDAGLKELLRESGNEALEATPIIIGWGCQHNTGTVLLVIPIGNVLTSWVLYVQHDNNPERRRCSVERVLTHARSGDTANSAIFFVQKYFPGHPKLPLRRLLPLAAHAVLMAGKLNPAGVSGLDIVLCTRTGFRRLEEDEINKLVDQSIALDSYTTDNLGLQA